MREYEHERVESYIQLGAQTARDSNKRTAPKNDHQNCFVVLGWDGSKGATGPIYIILRLVAVHRWIQIMIQIRKRWLRTSVTLTERVSFKAQSREKNGAWKVLFPRGYTTTSTGSAVNVEVVSGWHCPCGVILDPAFMFKHLLHRIPCKLKPQREQK